jgi:hypothetical protein
MAIKSSLTFLLVLLIFAVGNAQSLVASSGHVKGTVFDSNGAVITNIKVIFETNGLKSETITNGEGFYKIELPVGVYRITTYSPGFCAAQRALFRVQSLSDILLDLTLDVCPIVTTLKMNKSGKFVSEEDRYIDPIKSESFPIRDSSGAPLNLLVRYGKRVEGKGIIEYQGVQYQNGVPSSITVSYDLLTIVADKVRFNRKTLLLEADGRVTVEDGKQSMNFSHVEFNFKSKDPTAMLNGKK